MPPPPGNKALLRPNLGTMVVNPLIRPYFLGGGGGIGVLPLDSHEIRSRAWGMLLGSDIFSLQKKSKTPFMFVIYFFDELCTVLVCPPKV